MRQYEGSHFPAYSHRSGAARPARHCGLISLAGNALPPKHRAPDPDVADLSLATAQGACSSTAKSAYLPGAMLPTLSSTDIVEHGGKDLRRVPRGLRRWRHYGGHQPLPAARSSAALEIEPATSPATSEIKPRRYFRSIDPPGATWSVSVTMATPGRTICLASCGSG